MAPLEAFSETFIYRQMFFKIVVKIFENFTRKHLCRSLVLIKFITNRLQHRFFSSEICEIYTNVFLQRIPGPEGCFRILQELCLYQLREFSYSYSMCLQLIYFLNRISFWFVECLFLINGTLKLGNYFQSVTEFTLRFLFRLNQPLWKIHGNA